MKKSRKLSFVSLIVFFCFQLIIFGCARDGAKKLCIKNCCIQVELAQTPSEKKLGLMFRESIADNRGMLFIFEQEDRHGFWMKNMKFPLDIVWIGSNKKIVDISKNALPCNQTCEDIFPVAKSKYVLEVNSGFADNKGIKIGDRVDF